MLIHIVLHFRYSRYYTDDTLSASPGLHVHVYATCVSVYMYEFYGLTIWTQVLHLHGLLQ